MALGRPTVATCSSRAFGVLGGVGVQAVLGGITVRTGLNPYTVSAHFLVSMCLVAASAYLVFRAPEPAGPRPLAVHPLVERLGLGHLRGGRGGAAPRHRRDGLRAALR